MESLPSEPLSAYEGESQRAFRGLRRGQVFSIGGLLTHVISAKDLQ